MVGFKVRVTIGFIVDEALRFQTAMNGTDEATAMIFIGYPFRQFLRMHDEYQRLKHHNSDGNYLLPMLLGSD